MDKDGNPLLTWSDDTPGNEEIYVVRWDGAEWEELGDSASAGGISSNKGESSNPSMVIDNLGNPVVAWQDDEESDGAYAEIYLSRWNGASWEELSGSASNMGITGGPIDKYLSEHPSLALDGNGNPAVAWHESPWSGDREICFLFWNGTDWDRLGDSTYAPEGCVSSDDNNSEHPSLAFDGNGHPVVAWQNMKPNSGYEIFLKRWNGSEWVELSGSASSGGISDNTGSSEHPSLVLDGDGNPVVAWQDDTSSDFMTYEIYLLKWNGTAWEELSGSASAGGVSANEGSSEHPSLALDDKGNPVVAWQDATSGQYEIYLRRWNGVEWEELDGSSSGGGVSNSTAASFSPSVVTGEGIICVAWHEMGRSSTEILLRCYSH
jgi:hypothetical protein